MPLWSDFLTNNGRIVQKWKHYFPAYERHFAKFVNTDLTFLEIGCGAGGSLQLWKRYFGPHQESSASTSARSAQSLKRTKSACALAISPTKRFSLTLSKN